MHQQSRVRFPSFMPFCPSVLGRIFPGYSVSGQRKSAQPANLLKSHSCNKEKYEGKLSGTSYLNPICYPKTLDPLDSKEIKLVNPKGNQPWIFIGRTDAEAEAPILWPPNVKIRLTGKDLDARKDWRQEKKRVTEDEMIRWQHWLNRHEFEQTPGDS